LEEPDGEHAHAHDEDQQVAVFADKKPAECEYLRQLDRRHANKAADNRQEDQGVEGNQEQGELQRHRRHVSQLLRCWRSH
jgi:hypothetical protein